MKAPLVSVVIPCHNVERFVAEAITSVTRQSHDAVEIIVVDDGSTDESVQMIRESSNEVHLILNQQRRGACAARNTGAERATGEFLLFLDADDLIHPETLTSLLDAHAAAEAELAICPWQYLVGADSSWEIVDNGMEPDPPHGDYMQGWLGDWWVPPCAILWRRNAFVALGGWDESLEANQDGDLLLRALLRGASIARSYQGLGLYRKHSGVSISGTVSRETVASRRRVYHAVQHALAERGDLDRYRITLGRSWYRLARTAYSIDRREGRICEAEAWKLAGRAAVSGTTAHRLSAWALGLGRKEALSSWIRGAKGRLNRVSS